MTTAYARIAATLRSGGTVLLDGATGTELERRGAPMDEGAWCALATASHPDLLRQIHADYIAAGSDVVTANTFSTNPHLLGRTGKADQTGPLLRRSVEIAREAVAASGRAVAVAGSISTNLMPTADGEIPAFGAELVTDKAERDYAMIAQTLADSGCDLLVLEMIGDVTYGGIAYRAARATGLPVWVGISAKHGADGKLAPFDDTGEPFPRLLDAVASWQPDAIGVMHTALPDIAPTLDALRAVWSGPTMAYPEAGWFEMPSWKFVEIDPTGFAEAALGWKRQGALILGGCCGLGPAHIAALAKALA